MTTNRFHVIKDTREKENHGWWYPEDAYCSGTTKAKIDLGDYTVEGLEHLLCIERKETVAEFAGNCSEQRFWRVIDKMAEYKHKFLILEFDWYAIERYPEGSGVPKEKWPRVRIKGNYMMSLLSTMMLDKGIQVIAAGNKDRAERIAYRIMRKCWEFYNR